MLIETAIFFVATQQLGSQLSDPQNAETVSPTQLSFPWLRYRFVIQD
jgi:hypothetical protein